MRHSLQRYIWQKIFRNYWPWWRSMLTFWIGLLQYRSSHMIVYYSLVFDIFQATSWTYFSGCAIPRHISYSHRDLYQQCTYITYRNTKLLLKSLVKPIQTQMLLLSYRLWAPLFNHWPRSKNFLNFIIKLHHRPGCTWIRKQSQIV